MVGTLAAPGMNGEGKNGAGLQKLKGGKGKCGMPSMNGGIFSPLGPGIPLAGANGF